MPGWLTALIGMVTPFAKYVGPVLVLCALVSGCARDEPKGRAATLPEPAPHQDGTSTSLPSAARALAVTVDVHVRARDVTGASSKLRAAAETHGGYVSNGLTSGEGDDASAQIDVRVPKDQLAAVRSTIASLGDVVSESEKVEDLTEQHADLDARLHNARAEEQRLLELMANKTGNISDLLTAERELARVRETVERLDAEKRTMDTTIALATVHVSISGVNASAAQTPGKSIGQAWSAGVNGARSMAVFAAMFVATVSPTLVPILAFIALVIMASRRLRRKLA